MISELVISANIPREKIYEVTFVGNTTMNHLMLNINPSAIAHAPYVSVLRRGVYAKAHSLGIHIVPHGKVFALPNIAGFVGGDTVGVILATGIHHSDKVQIAIDIGTNTEVVIGNKEKMLACSCAARPRLRGRPHH